VKKQIKVTVNGVVRGVEIDTRARLVDVIRDNLQLTGTHIGCGTGSCGACTVMLNGRTAKSCCTLAIDVDGGSISTIEGISDDGQLHPVQEAFVEYHALQCGFCTPGMILSTLQLLESNPAPDDEQIRDGIAGNICRCTGYVNIVAAIREAAKRMSHASSD
jgi:aerobic carbon-monoxide dehydrogenase small subunit